MKELISKFDALLVSVTFAEAGEYEASKQVLVGDANETGEAEPCLGI